MLAKSYLIEFAFESVVVEMIGEVLQFVMFVAMDSGVVIDSMDLAVVYSDEEIGMSEVMEQGMVNV